MDFSINWKSTYTGSGNNPNKKKTIVNYSLHVLYFKAMVLWNFDLLFKTMVLWYYGQNYGTILRTIELRFTKKKSMVDYQILRNFDL